MEKGTQDNIIEIRNLDKSFGKNKVLKGLSLGLKSGSIVAIMGPNGSGKTTLLKTILGLIKPDSGDMYVNSIHLNGSPGYREHIGYMPQNACFPENLKVKEVISMLKDVKGKQDKYDEELIEKLSLEDIYEKQIGTLSSGTKQRVNGSVAFLFDQEIIILDEPTAGLDPVSSEIFKKKILAEKEKGKLVIITSHIISEVEELADRVIFLLEGKVYIDSTVSELVERSGESNLNKAIAKLMENHGYR
jgi:Cu-processing system ATP-binding protein